MSGIVGSYFNTRGSGIVAKLGTDGQVFTSTGPGLSQGFEAAAGGTGKVLQVVSINKTAVESINSSATAFTNISGLSATITPSSTSSKIFIMASVVISFSNNTYGSLGGIRIQRGTTGLNAGGESYSSTTVVGQNESADNGRATLPIQFLDSPSTTSATTYNIGVKNAIGGTVTCIINGNKSASNTGSSTITIMEIAE